MSLISHQPAAELLRAELETLLIKIQRALHSEKQQGLQGRAAPQQGSQQASLHRYPARAAQKPLEQGDGKK